MREIFRELLESIDSRLPGYFLVKGGRLEVAPLTAHEYNNLLSNGYQPIVEVEYTELDRSVLEALNRLINGLGNRALLLFPLAVSAIISHEARRSGSPLNIALYSEKEKAAKEGTSEEAIVDKRQRRRKE